MRKDIRQYQNGVQFDYVLDCIHNPDSDNEMQDREKVQYFFNCFNSEFNYLQNKIQYPNIQERIEQYLRGLPSCFAVGYTYEHITETGKNWGYCKTEKESTKFVDRWFSVLAFRLIQLKEYFNI